MLDKYPVSYWVRSAKVSYSKAIRIRRKLGVGEMVAPHTWLLTGAEWTKVMGAIYAKNVDK